jgi:hypothetical protein
MTKRVNLYVILINEQKNALIEGVGAKLKCVYWITQQKHWSKKKNRVRWEQLAAGSGQQAWHGASFDKLPATTRGTGRTGRGWRKKREGMQSTVLQ